MRTASWMSSSPDNRPMPLWLSPSAPKQREAHHGDGPLSLQRALGQHLSWLARAISKRATVVPVPGFRFLVCRC